MPEAFSIAVLPGDGIGTEVMDAALAVLDCAVALTDGLAVHPTTLPGGAAHYRDTGVALPEETLAAADAADAILFGAMGLPSVRAADGTEVIPQLDLRFHFNLYAGVRPCKRIPYSPCPLADPRAADIDFVLVRESTEGLFSSRGNGLVVNDAVATDTMVITRATSERLFNFAFRLAERRKAKGKAGRVTCVDKANVFRSMAFFRKIFDETAVRFPNCTADHQYVDAMALELVRQPWAFDVLVTENMFGDILSDQAAALVGGMGYAPSADIGDTHALFQPAHGTAPDIAGRGLANPTAMILSAAMMLDWLGETHDHAPARAAGERIESAVEAAFAERRLSTAEYGGADGTAAVTNAVLDMLR
ncbi:MAG: isocitrate/isopropylmalate dehydrogenase family protein [Rhodothermales bacterium]